MGVVRRGGRKPIPCAGVEAEKELADQVVPADGVPKVPAVVVASCGAESVDGMASKPLPSGSYSKRVSKQPLKEVRAAAGKKGGSLFAGRGVDAKTVRMHETCTLRYYDKEGHWPSRNHARRVSRVHGVSRTIALKETTMSFR